MSNTLTLQAAQENLKEVFRNLCKKRNAYLNDFGANNGAFDQRELALLDAFEAVGLSHELADEIYEQVFSKTYTQEVDRYGQITYKVV